MPVCVQSFNPAISSLHREVTSCTLGLKQFLPIYKVMENFLLKHNYIIMSMIYSRFFLYCP